jgi:hypothetical protein
VLLCLEFSSCIALSYYGSRLWLLNFCSVVGGVTGLWVGQSGVDFQQRGEIFHSSKTSTRSPGPTWPSIQWVMRSFFAGVKWSIRELPSCVCLVLKLQMSEVVPLFPLCGFMACTKTTYLFLTFLTSYLQRTLTSFCFLCTHYKTVYKGMIVRVCVHQPS